MVLRMTFWLAYPGVAMITAVTISSSRLDSSAAVPPPPPPQPHRTSQAQDDVTSSRRHSGSGALSTSKTSSTGSIADHQPCIIPDSPITTRGCSDTHPPTEPRSVTSASGRPAMDLLLPRCGFDRHRLRPAVTQPSDMDPASTVLAASLHHRQCVVSSSSSSSSVVTVRTDVAAPFSPGLLSPAMSPQALRLDTSTTTTTTTATTTTVTVNSTSSTIHSSRVLPAQPPSSRRPVWAELSRTRHLLQVLLTAV